MKNHVHNILILSDDLANFPSPQVKRIVIIGNKLVYTVVSRVGERLKT